MAEACTKEKGPFGDSEREVHTAAFQHFVHEATSHPQALLRMSSTLPQFNIDNNILIFEKIVNSLQLK